ncbi:hypothetical protein FKW77_003581 [Venturia effusa]|uniref:Uncharacterized protein n=1 Tax=Venturia effusa TaxID=50376 RepID=A0A517LGW9_9PEZI|nr:hypothetical protein FKW77_003581 [Venturia effusa]
MCDHDVENNLPSSYPSANTSAFTNVTSTSDNIEDTARHHGQAQLTEDSMAPPDTINSDADRLRPDQLGFSDFGFTPLPLTALPLNEPGHVRKVSGKRDARAVLNDVAHLFGTMDDEGRAKFVVDIGRIVGWQENEERTQYASTENKEEMEESTH